MSARLDAAIGLRSWLERGGPADGATKGSKRSAARKKGAAPFFLSSQNITLSGSEDNLTIKATAPLPKGELIVAVAVSCCLHPRSEHIASSRQEAVTLAANAIRNLASDDAGFRTPLFDLKDAGRLELVVVLAQEILSGADSKWASYLKSLPSPKAAAPPSLWAHTCGDDAAAAALQSTSIGPVVAADARSLEALIGPGARGGSGPAELWQALGGDTQEARSALVHAFGASTLPRRSPGCRVGGASRGASHAADAVTDCRIVRPLAGLVLTRMVSGVGMVPYFDCANGTVAGRHNATIERSQLATTRNGEAAPCVAAISSRAIAAGEYGDVAESNAARFSHTPARTAPAPRPHRARTAPAPRTHRARTAHALRTHRARGRNAGRSC